MMLKIHPMQQLLHPIVKFCDHPKWWEAANSHYSKDELQIWSLRYREGKWEQCTTRTAEQICNSEVHFGRAVTAARMAKNLNNGSLKTAFNALLLTK